MTREIVHAYRHLLRHSLHAILYAKPARFTLLTHLRHSFRSSPSTSFHTPTINLTLVFLQNAAKYTGTEQKIVKNLLHVWGCRHRDIPSSLRQTGDDIKFRHQAYDKFDQDVKMLERTLGIRLT